MKSRAFASALIVKEFRTLLPVWIAGLVAIGAAFMASDSRILLPAALGYAIAAVALGVQTVGHEYTNGTIGLLLVQPMDRKRVLVIKLAVLFCLLSVLGAAAWFAPFNAETWHRPWVWKHPAVALLPIVAGFFIAPWLTMVCRNPLAGIVFTASVPGTLMFGGELIGVVRFGVGHPDVDAFRDQFWLSAMILTVGAGAALTWRTFLRLEAIEGTGSDVQMPRWFSAERPASRHPLWLLMWKELHLQQMTLVVVVLFCIGWATLSLLKDLVPAFADAPLVPVTIIYFVLLSVLIGSLASAEERNLGVVQWQMLLPMAAWQQWLVKVVVALGLALMMGVALPILLNYLSPAPDDFEIGRLWRQTAIMITVLTSLSLYVSSLSGSAIRAMLLAFPIGIGALVLAGWFQAALFESTVAMTGRGSVVRSYSGQMEWMAAGLAAVIVMSALILACVNHRSIEGGFRRIAVQVLWLVAVPLAGVLLFAGVLVARMLVEGNSL